MWKYWLSGLLYAVAFIILFGSLLLSFLEYHAPGLIRALLHYLMHRLLRRGNKPREYAVGEKDRLGDRPFCPSGCDANDDLPDEVIQNEFEAHRELPKFRHVVRTRCKHAGESGFPVHCHDVRELRLWERNWLMYGILALVRLRLGAKSCPEYVQGILADHLHPVSGPVNHNVYFVNGIYTNAKSASRQRQHIEDFLGDGFDVRLLHNRIDLRLDPLQLSHDYTWGLASSPATKPFRSQPALAAYAILMDGFRRDAEVAFIGFSGGTLQIAMAIRAFRTVPEHQPYLRRKVRVIAAGNMIHKSCHLDMSMTLLQFEPHVDRQDPFARAFTGDTYTFDDGRSFDLGMPEWREEINIALWAKVGMELLVHDDIDRYHSIENNYVRGEPWKAPGDKADRKERHVKFDAFGAAAMPTVRAGEVVPVEGSRKKSAKAGGAKSPKAGGAKSPKAGGAKSPKAGGAKPAKSRPRK